MDLEVGMRSLSWTMNLGFQVGIRVLRLGFGFQGGGGYEGSDDLCSRLKLELWFWSDMCLD